MRARAFSCSGGLAAIAIAAALLAGCGSEDGSDQGASGTTAPLGASTKSCPSPEGTSDLRVFAISCDQGADTAVAWRRSSACPPRRGASRGSCMVRNLRCFSIRNDRGTAVSCAGPSRALSFLAERP